MKNGSLLTLLVLTTLALTSCKKEQDTLAKITVLDTNGQPFQDATVRVFGDPTISPHPAAVMDRTLYTDSKGQVIFDFTEDFKFGQAGFTVLTIEITSGDSLGGEGIIKIEEEKLNEETLIIQPI